MKKSQKRTKKTLRKNPPASAQAATCLSKEREARYMYGPSLCFCCFSLLLFALFCFFCHSLPLFASLCRSNFSLQLLIAFWSSKISPNASKTAPGPPPRPPRIGPRPPQDPPETAQDRPKTGLRNNHLFAPIFAPFWEATSSPRGTQNAPQIHPKWIQNRSKNGIEI